MTTAQAAVDAARAAIAPEALAPYDAAAATLAKENRVKGAFEKAVNDALTAAAIRWSPTRTRPSPRRRTSSTSSRARRSRSS